MTAAKERTSFPPEDPCAFENPSVVLPLAAAVPVAENSHQGFSSKKINPHPGWSEVNFKTATGIEPGLRREGIRSRCQSLNRYAYVLNRPTTMIDPSGLIGAVGCDPFTGIGCDECDPFTGECPNPQPPFWPVGPPTGSGGGSGGGGGGGGGTTGGGSGAGGGGGLPTRGWPNGGDYGPIYPLNLWQLYGLGGVNPYPCDFGVCGGAIPDNGFGPGALALPAAEGLGGLVCFGSGACEVALTVAGGIAAGVALYKGIETGIQIYQSRAEQRLLDYIARAYCVDRNQLGEEVEAEKTAEGRGGRDNLPKDRIRDIARRLPKIPNCTPTAR